LEASVAQQQETITKMLPGRRGVLKAGALLGGGALVGAGTADRASAQASGQVGTSNDPVDVEAYDLAVQNQLSSSVDVGGNDLTNVGSINTTDVTIDAPAGVAQVGAIGGGGELISSNEFTLSDDGSETLIPNFVAGQAAMGLIRSASSGDGIMFTATSSNITLQNTDGSWATSDTDTNHCLFKDSNANLVLKNRQGSPESYIVVLVNIS